MSHLSYSQHFNKYQQPNNCHNKPSEVLPNLASSLNLTDAVVAVHDLNNFDFNAIPINCERIPLKK